MAEQYTHKPQDYTDKGDEGWLYDQIVTKKRKDFQKMLSEQRDSWVVRSHLSKQRHHLLMPFNFSGNTLEIGAGCGGVTEILLSKSDSVTSLEPATRRFEILSARYDDKNHFTPKNILLNELAEDLMFDNIVIVGILEYAALSEESTNNPYLDFVKQCYKHLKPEGNLYLAIENKIGLKYLTGALEDHTHIMFEGLEDYPKFNQYKRRTFTKHELNEIFENAGFSNYEYYYPFPDYKMPTDIYSEEGLNQMDLISSGVFPTVPNEQYRDYLYSEALLFSTLKNGRLHHEFPNSFMLRASKQDIDKNIFLYSRFKEDKPRNLKTHTIVRNQRTVEKTFFSKNRGEEYQKVKNTLGSTFNYAKVISSDKNSMCFEFIEGETQQLYLFKILKDQGLEVFTQEIKKLSNQLPENLLFVDLNFNNLIRDGAKLTLIDFEILLDKKVSKDVVITRAIVDFFTDNAFVIFTLLPEVDSIKDFIYKLDARLMESLEELFALEVEISNQRGQKEISESLVMQAYPVRGNYKTRYVQEVEKNMHLEEASSKYQRYFSYNFYKIELKLNKVLKKLRSILS